MVNVSPSPVGLVCWNSNVALKSWTSTGPVAYALAAWLRPPSVSASVLTPGALGGAAIFAGLFALQAIWDHRSAADAGAPEWYPLLRQVLTGGAMIVCLLIPLATVLRRF